MTSQVAHLLHTVLYSATRSAKGWRRLPLKSRGVVRKATERCCPHGHWAPVGRNRVLSVPFRVFLPLSVPACTDLFLPLSVPACTDILLPCPYRHVQISSCPCPYRHVQISYCLVRTGMYSFPVLVRTGIQDKGYVYPPLSLLSLPRSRSLSAPHSFRHSLLVVPMRRTLLGTDVWSSDTASTSGAARRGTARHGTARHGGRSIDELHGHGRRRTLLECRRTRCEACRTRVYAANKQSTHATSSLNVRRHTTSNLNVWRHNTMSGERPRQI